MIVVSDELARTGGSPRSQLELARGLAMSGIEVDLVYLRPGAWLESWSGVARRCRPLGYRAPGRSSSRAAGALRLVRNARAGLAMAPRLGRRCREVVLARGHEEIFSAATIAWARRTPLVIHLSSLPPKRKLSDFELGDRLAFGAVSRFFSVAAHLADAWAATGLRRDRIDVVPTGLDLDHWHPMEQERERLRDELRIERDAPVPLFVGRFDPSKGLGTLADACAELRSRRPTLCLVALGASAEPGRDETEIVAHLRRALPDDALRIAPMVDDVRPWLALADVVTAPSLFAEPFARVVLEALACGRPVVASDVGGNREAFGERFAARLYEATDPRALARRLDELLDWRRVDPDLAARCRAHVASRFTLDRAVEGAVATFRAARSRLR